MSPCRRGQLGGRPVVLMQPYKFNSQAIKPSRDVFVSFLLRSSSHKECSMNLPYLYKSITLLAQKGFFSKSPPPSLRTCNIIFSFRCIGTCCSCSCSASLHQHSRSPPAAAALNNVKKALPVKNELRRCQFSSVRLSDLFLLELLGTLPERQKVSFTNTEFLANGIKNTVCNSG